jgi:hypothetical protein
VLHGCRAVFSAVFVVLVSFNAVFALKIWQRINQLKRI